MNLCTATSLSSWFIQVRKAEGPCPERDALDGIPHLAAHSGASPSAVRALQQSNGASAPIIIGETRFAADEI
jgi:hypothetical protein